jgi:hypothetical protein
VPGKYLAQIVDIEWHESIQGGDMRRIIDAAEIEIERLCRE